MSIPRQRTWYRRGSAAAGVAAAAAAALLLLARASAPGGVRGALGLAVAVAAVGAMDRLLRPRGAPAVPILTYHSVAPPELRARWEKIGWWNLTITPALFDWQLRYLARRRFVSVGLGEVHAHMRGERAAPPRAVVLTFDDGYVDNWTFAAPLLERHGFRATVFVSSDFVEARAEPRPTLADAWGGRCALDQIPCVGYLSWTEIAELERRGIMEVQGHGTTHAWHFASERIVDFYHDASQYVWLFWNLQPARKVRWQEEDLAAGIGFGRPVYAYHRGQARRRYREDEGVAAALIETVRAEGGELFFRRPDWRERLAAAAAAERAARPEGGRWETREEYIERVREDLGRNKRELEARLGHETSFLAWPGNAWGPQARRIALEDLGFHATSESGGFNRPGEDPTWFGRAHVESCFEGTPWGWLDRLEFVAKIELFAGNGWYLALAFPLNLLRRAAKRRGARRPGGAADSPVPEGIGVEEPAP